LSAVNNTLQSLKSVVTYFKVCSVLLM